MLIGKYGIPFEFYITVEDKAADSSDRFVNAAVPWAAGDVKVDKDGAGVANITTLPTRIGSTPLYKVNLSAAEMQATNINVYLVDADGPEWKDVHIAINTNVRPYLHSGVAQAGAAGSITSASGASATADFYIHQVIQLVGGTGVGQARIVLSYNGTTKVLVPTRAWNTTPDNTTQYVILPGPDVWNIPEPTEPATAPAGGTISFGVILQHLLRRFFNKVTQTASQQIVYKDDGTTACSTMTCANDGTTQTKGAAS